MDLDRVLVIAPHPDDDILGVGGFLKKLSNSGSEILVLTVSGHLPPLYKKEDFNITLKEAKRAHELVGVSNSEYWEIPATKIADMPISEFNGKFDRVIKDFKPSLVLCPFPDRHIDHRLVFDAAMVATRPVGVGNNIKLLAAYETLSETHWNAPHIESNFVPTWVVDITHTIEDKKKALACFESQITPFPGPRSIEAVDALAKFRGTQAGFAYGEGLQIIRMVS
tara:strand:+ start:130 stop:801 length:672 start_codon:yes stop_codon:yes gene_type:complete